jgi:hypothetical protein
MPCTATIPNLTAREQAHQLYEAIPPGLFRVQDETERIAWRVSPEPYALSKEQLDAIERLGPDLLAFYRVLNNLYNRSARGTAPAFIAEYLDCGKPEQIVKLGRQNRFKQDVPGVIRPDLIVTDDGFAATELDSIPGGMGFVGAMMEAYCRLGIESVGGADGIPAGFAALMRHVTGIDHPTVAIVVSDESADYRNEMAWLAATLRRLGLADAWLRRPQEITFTEEGLFIRHEDGREAKLDALYRNFELFDLFNVPKQELMLYAARHNRVRITPAPKASLEEKSAFALFHHHALATLWRAELGGERFERLQRIFPKTWIIDPRPMPPQAVIAGLQAGGAPISDFRQLGALPKSERAYVVKPSGFSELAWGSRGVKIGDDMTREEWQAALDTALASYDRTPWILQHFHKGKRIRQSYFDREHDEIREYDGRVRLCPYYFVTGEETVQLGGVLATIAPADKRLIHGMTDAVMTSSIPRSASPA